MKDPIYFDGRNLMRGDQAIGNTYNPEDAEDIANAFAKVEATDKLITRLNRLENVVVGLADIVANLDRGSMGGARPTVVVLGEIREDLNGMRNDCQ